MQKIISFLFIKSLIMAFVVLSANGVSVPFLEPDIVQGINGARRVNQNLSVDLERGGVSLRQGTEPCSRSMIRGYCVFGGAGLGGLLSVTFQDLERDAYAVVPWIAVGAAFGGLAGYFWEKKISARSAESSLYHVNSAFISLLPWIAALMFEYIQFKSADPLHIS